MRRQLIFAAASIFAAAALLMWGLMPGMFWRGDGETPVVGLVLDTDIGLHVATIKQGAKLAARELRAELIMDAPTPGEDAASAQRTLIRRQLAQGISALLLAPASDALIEEAAAAAREANVHLVLLDSGAREGLRYVSTDHAASGAQAIAALKARAPAPVRLLILTAPGGDSLCAERLQGARGAIDEAGGIEIAATLVCGDVSEADTKVRDALRADPGINALLCMNGALSEVAARALAALGRTETVPLIGFDCDQTRVTYLQSGAVRATVLRSPLNIGYLGVYRALDDGPNVFTPSYVVDKANMLDPMYVKLVFPLVQ